MRPPMACMSVFPGLLYTHRYMAAARPPPRAARRIRGCANATRTRNHAFQRYSKACRKRYGEGRRREDSLPQYMRYAMFTARACAYLRERMRGGSARLHRPCAIRRGGLMAIEWHTLQQPASSPPVQYRRTSTYSANTRCHAARAVMVLYGAFPQSSRPPDAAQQMPLMLSDAVDAFRARNSRSALPINTFRISRQPEEALPDSSMLFADLLPPPPPPLMTAAACPSRLPRHSVDAYAFPMAFR